MSSSQPGPWAAQRRLLILLLILTFVRGLLYMAVMPPWQHYDEPTHFEHVRLIATRYQLPQVGDYDLEMRREIAASMQAASFWRENPKIDFWSEKPPAIGVSELHHPPLYYSLLAAPQLLATYQDVETQLYLGRLVSVLLYLVVVGAAYGLVRETFPYRPWLPIAVATFIALLPPFTDLMSSVNNDVGAVAVVSLLLWSSVRLLRRGLSLKRAASVLLLAGACFFTKNTASIAAVIILLTIAASLIPSPQRRWLWIGLVLAIPVVLVSAFSWGGHAASWYSNGPPSGENRAAARTFLGDAVFVLSNQGKPYTRVLFQELGKAEGERLSGRTVTVGSWLRAGEEPGGVLTLSLREKGRAHVHQFPTTTDWQFYAFTTTLSAEMPGVMIHISLPPGDRIVQTTYLDGIVLVEGQMPLTEIPQFETSQGARGTWGGQPFTNLAQNNSAEAVWPGLHGAIGDKTVYQNSISMILASLLDWPRTSWTYPLNLFNLHKSFWGMFGWGHLVLPNVLFYPLLVPVAVAFVGNALGLLRRRKPSKSYAPWQHWAWTLICITALTSWVGALTRIHPLLITQRIYWPVARYAATAIAPTALLLILGLTEILPRRWQKAAGLLSLLGMITWDAIALGTVILPYYYG